MTIESTTNVVILSDGTGNSQSSPFKTNVWRIYENLSLNDDQIAKYDDGVGSAANIFSRYLGGAFGFGLKRNVIDLYIFLCHHYQEDRNLYFFGFSRGAFTIRLLIDLIAKKGLLTCPYSVDKYELLRRATKQFDDYRFESVSTKAPPLFRLLGHLRRALSVIGGSDATTTIRIRQVEKITFVGLWDTVDAYIIPLQSLRNFIDRWIYPVSFRTNKLSEKVTIARHALALDDTRATFHPILWEEEFIVPADASPADIKTKPRQQILQLWFAGAHADVGGGYADDRLAHVPLHWMMQESAAQGIRFDAGAMQRVERYSWPMAAIHDSRRGAGVYYRYKPRIAKRSHDGEAKLNVRVHDSVHERLKSDEFDYAPLSLRVRSYDVYGFRDDERSTRARGSFSLNFDMQAAANLIWWRQVTYYLFLFFSLMLLSLPLWTRARVTTDFLVALLPAIARPWVTAVKAAPVLSCVGVVVLLFLWYLNKRLEGRIDQRSVAARH
jgi:uncharacterized protein (DUF2235 family)